MALEALITELIAELKANTAAHKGAAGASTAASTKAPPASTAPKIEMGVLKSLGTKVSEKHGKPFAKNLIKTVGGAADLANVKPDKFTALHAAFEKSLNEEVASETASEDDEL